MGRTLKKLLIISGPTATGKSHLAIHLRKLFNGELLSADSRQVYKHMDIGTGKDLNSIGKILGYNLVSPDEEFSVSQYAKYAKEYIREIWKRDSLPIIVGGTGLYIKAVVGGIETINIPKDEELRINLSKHTPEQLFNLLVGLDPIKAASMNQSDVKNPRRLMRAIEVANSKSPRKEKKFQADVLWIGLSAPLERLKEKIEKRVDERITAGFEKEYDALKKMKMFDRVASTTLGYREWPDIKKWKSEELKYAKRQLVWFKKEKRINWFNIEEPQWQKNIVKLVKKWYSSLDAKEN